MATFLFGFQFGGWCGHTIPEAPPCMWKHAGLDSLKTFLEEEQRAGRYKPQVGLPFDD